MTEPVPLSAAAIAHHEAGHAVVARKLDQQVDTVTIAADGEFGGHTLNDYGVDNVDEVRYSGDEDQIQLVFEHAIMSALAGEIAQRRFQPESVDPYHAAGDRASVSRYLDELADPEDAELRDAWQRLLELRTERLVEQQWHAVQWVAHRLVECKTLSGEELDEAIDDADLPLEHRGKHLTLAERGKILAT
jgi:hypothetical protein